MGDLVFDTDLVLEGDDNNFHLPNLPGEDFRRIFAQTTNDRSALNMRVKLLEVHHGEMFLEGENHPTTLLVFESRFQSRLQDHRYTSAVLTFEFFDKEAHDKKKSTTRDPVVVRLAPDRVHFLNKTTYDRKVMYGASASARGGPEVGGGEVGVHWDVEQTKPLHFKATLTGSSEPSKGSKSSAQNAVKWTMEQNKDEEDGIPTFLQTAVLLKRPSGKRPFIVKLRIKSEVDFKSMGLRAIPFKSDDRDEVIHDVVIWPNKIQVQNFEVTGIREEDLVHMEKLPISQYFKVNLSEEDLLTPPIPSDSIPQSMVAPHPQPAVSSQVTSPQQEAPVIFEAMPFPPERSSPALAAREQEATPLKSLLIQGTLPETLVQEEDKFGTRDAASVAMQAALEATALATEAAAEASRAASAASRAAAAAAAAASRAAEAAEKLTRQRG